MYNLFNRLFVIIVSLITLIIIIPVFIAIIIILKFSAEGYVFYLQDRIGKNEKKFKIIKYAIMLKDSPNLASGSITIAGDWRLTKPGKFLRKTKINELPQIFNILKGDISLVDRIPLMNKNILCI